MLAIAPAEVGGTAVRKEEVRVLRAARTGVRRAARRRVLAGTGDALSVLCGKGGD